MKLDSIHWIEAAPAFSLRGMSPERQPGTVLA
jgi:hypothetical protein